MDGLKIIALIVSALAALAFISALAWYISGRRERYEYPRRDAWNRSVGWLIFGLVVAVGAGIIWFIALGGVR